MLIPQDGLLLAPMAGVSDKTYRAICRTLGADATYTEMISAKGFLLMPREREDALALRECTPGEYCAVQIFGAEPQTMARAAEQLAASRFFAVDINMGCPAPKIVSGGAGSAMLRDLANAQAVVRAVVKACPLPVTVKMRMGWDQDSLCHVEAARRFADSGAAAITLHGRTRVALYGGKANWDAIGEVVQSVNIPVIGNGDVTCAVQATDMRTYTGCHAVMVGRGAMGNPWIFREHRARLLGQVVPAVTVQERFDMALAHARALIAHKGEYMGVREMRKHMAWYLTGMPGSAQARARVNATLSYPQMQELVQEYMRQVLSL